MSDSEAMQPFMTDPADPVRWLGGPFYNAVNATAQYVAAYAAIVIADILAPSFFLVGLKYALLLAFVARMLDIASSELPGRDQHWIVMVAKILGSMILALVATFAANAVVEAGLVQLDDAKTEKAIAISRLYQNYRRIGMNYGCYDPDQAAITPMCQTLSLKLAKDLRALEHTSKVSSSNRYEVTPSR